MAHVGIKPSHLHISKKISSSHSQLAEYKRKMHNIWVEKQGKTKQRIIYIESDDSESDNDKEEHPLLQAPQPLIQAPQPLIQAPQPQLQEDVEFVKEIIIVAQRNAQIKARSRIQDLYNNPLLQMNVEEQPFNGGQHY
jgi:hypothetical protein